MTTSESKSRPLADLEYLEMQINQATPEELYENATNTYNLIAQNIGKIKGTPDEHLKPRYMALANKILKYLPTPKDEEVRNKSKNNVKNPLRDAQEMLSAYIVGAPVIADSRQQTADSENTNQLAATPSPSSLCTTNYALCTNTPPPTTHHSPLISICMPAYNASKYIQVTLESVLSQPYKNYEIVIIDDGSIDDTADIIRSIQASTTQTIRYYHQENVGLPKTKNRLITLAKGEFCLWLDSDDILCKDVLCTYDDFIHRYPDVSVFYGNIKYFGYRQGEWISGDYYHKADAMNCNSAKGNSSIPNGGSLVKKTVYDMYGGYDESLNRANDSDFLIRIGGKVKVKSILTSTIYYRFHSQNMSVEKTKNQIFYKENAIILSHVLQDYTLQQLYPKLNWKSERTAKTIAYLEIAKNYVNWYAEKESLEYYAKAFFEAGLTTTIDTFDKVMNILKQIFTDNYIIEEHIKSISNMLEKKDKVFEPKYSLTNHKEKSYAQKKLHDTLKARGCENKFDLYNPHFEYVELLDIKLYPKISFIITASQYVESILKNINNIRAHQQPQTEIVLVYNGPDDTRIENIKQYTDTYIKLTTNTDDQIAYEIGSAFAVGTPLAASDSSMTSITSQTSTLHPPTPPLTTHHSPLISICMPAYNTGKYIQSALESVLSQSFSDYEIVIVDDGSTDDTADIIRSVQASTTQSIRYYYQENVGIPKTHNRLIQLAKGQFCLWFDSDDILCKDVLSIYNDYIHRYPDVSVFYGNIKLFGYNQNEWIPEDFYQKGKDIYKYAVQGYSPIPNGGSLVKKNVYEMCGGRNESFIRANDSEFLLRIAGKVEYKSILTYTMYYRHHTQNISVMKTTYKEYYSVNAKIISITLQNHNLPELFPLLDWNNEQTAKTIAYLEIAKYYAIKYAERESIEYYTKAFHEAGLSTTIDSFDIVLDILKHIFGNNTILNEHKQCIDNMLRLKDKVPENMYRSSSLHKKNPIAHKNLLDALQQKREEHKIEHYCPYFEYVEHWEIKQYSKTSLIFTATEYTDQVLSNLQKYKSQSSSQTQIIFINTGSDDLRFASIKQYIDTYIKLTPKTDNQIAKEIGEVFAVGTPLMASEIPIKADSGQRTVDSGQRTVDSKIVDSRQLTVDSENMNQLDAPPSHLTPYTLHLTPFISVLMPTYNNAKYIRASVESVITQPYQNFEILILNDGSTDNTDEVVKELLVAYPDKIRYYKQENAGIPASTNRLIKLAKGDFILLLDSDDLLYENVLDVYVDYIRRYPDASVFYGSRVQFGHCQNIYQPTDLYHNKELYMSRFVRCYCTIPNSSTVIKKSVFTEFGDYDERFIKSQDEAFWFRIAPHVEFKFIDTNSSYVRRHPTSISIARENNQEHNKYLAMIITMVVEKYSLQQLFPQLDWKKEKTARALAYLDIAKNYAKRYAEKESLCYYIKAFKEIGLQIDGVDYTMIDNADAVQNYIISANSSKLVFRNIIDSIDQIFGDKNLTKEHMDFINELLENKNNMPKDNFAPSHHKEIKVAQNTLLTALKAKGLESKFEIYKQYFEYIERWDIKQYPKTSYTITASQYSQSLLENLKTIDPKTLPKTETILVNIGSQDPSFETLKQSFDTYIMLKPNTDPQIAKEIAEIFTVGTPFMVSETTVNRPDTPPFPLTPNTYHLTPLLSICTFTYNRAKYIRTTIESILSQPYDNYEIIVLNDGSTDDTESIVLSLQAEHPDKIRYYYQENAGIPKSRNKLIELARGEYIMWIGSDDLLYKDILPVFIDHISKYPDVGVFYGLLTHFGYRQHTREVIDYYKKPDEILAMSIQGNSPIPDPSSIVKKTVYEEFGGYDETFKRAQDCDFWARIATRVLFKSINAFSVYYRTHDDNISNITTNNQSFHSYQAKVVTNVLKYYSLPQLFPQLDWKKEKTASVLAYLEIAKNYAILFADKEALAYYEKALLKMGIPADNLDFQKVVGYITQIFTNGNIADKHISCIKNLLQNKDKTPMKKFPPSRHKQKSVAQKNLKDALSKRGWDYKYSLYQKYFEYIELWDIKQNPKISVIVIAWQYNDLILENLKLLRQQQESDTEIVLLNNGSDDPRFDNLKQYIDTYIKLNANTGCPFARNLATVFANAPILAFIDDDCLPDENLIPSHLQIHQQYDVLVVRGRVLPRTLGSEKPPNYDLGPHMRPSPTNTEGNSSFKASVFYEVGGWEDDENIKGGEGRDLNYRIFQKYPLHRYQIYSPLPLIYHDFPTNPEHIKVKRNAVDTAFKKRREQYPDWDAFNNSWDTHANDDIVKRADSECIVGTQFIASETQIVETQFIAPETQQNHPVCFADTPPEEGNNMENRLDASPSPSSLCTMHSALRTDQPFFSVSMPTYNCGKYIQACIESVLTQPYQNFEIVVLDDGSTDDTEDIVKNIQDTHPEKIRYYKQENAGIPVSRNRLVDLAKGDFILWMDSDDLLYPGVLSVYVDFIAKYPDASVFYGARKSFGHNQDKYQPVDLYHKTDFYMSRFVECRCTIPNTTSVVKKSVYTQYGGYDETFKKSQDMAFWFRIAPHVQFKYIETISSYYRRHYTSIAVPRSDNKTHHQYEAKVITMVVNKYSLSQLFPQFDWTKEKAATTLAYLEIAKNYAKRYAENESLTYYIKAFKVIGIPIDDIEHATSSSIAFDKIIDTLSKLLGDSNIVQDHKDNICELLENKDNPPKQIFDPSFHKKENIAQKTLLTALKNKGCEHKYPLYSPYFDFLENWDIKLQPKTSVIITASQFSDINLEDIKALKAQQPQSQTEIILVNNGADETPFEQVKEFIDVYIKLKTTINTNMARDIASLFAKAPLIVDSRQLTVNSGKQTVDSRQLTVNSENQNRLDPPPSTLYPQSSTLHPLISILIATYNCGKYIRATLESVLTQPYQDYEIVILDDGSTDDTPEIVKSIQATTTQSIRYYYQENAGIPKTRNKLIDLAYGKYIMILDSDDILFKGVLPVFVDYIHHYPDASVFYGNIIMFGYKHLSLEYKDYYHNTAEMIPKLLGGGSFIPHSSSVVKKSVFTEYGGYNDDFKRNQDTQLWYRLAAKVEFKSIETYSLYYRIHGNNISSVKSSYQTYFADTAKLITFAIENFTLPQLFPSFDWEQEKTAKILAYLEIALEYTHRYADKEAMMFYCKAFTDAGIPLSAQTFDKVIETLNILLPNYKMLKKHTDKIDILLKYKDQVPLNDYLPNEHKEKKIHWKSFDNDLKRKGWEHKKDYLSPYFESVERWDVKPDPQKAYIIVVSQYSENIETTFIPPEPQSEIILVNNGPADQRFETLRPYIDTYVKVKENTSLQIAQDFGALYAKAQDILFIETPLATSAFPLHEALEKKGWLHKNDLYTQYFEYLEYLDVRPNPQISVIIIAWKYNDLILNNLKLLRTQIPSQTEIIFVNNGSDDPRFDTFKQYIDVYVKLNTNTGAYLARNFGALFAKSPILCFIDDDCIPDENLLQEHLNIHNQYDVILARGKVLPITSGSYIPNCYDLGNEMFVIESDIEGNTSVRADVFYEVDGWGDDIKIGAGGVDLSYRLLKKHPLHRYQVYSPKPLIYHDAIRDTMNINQRKKISENARARNRAKYSDWDEARKTWKSHKYDEIKCRDAACCVRNVNSGQRTADSELVNSRQFTTDSITVNQPDAPQAPLTPNTYHLTPKISVCIPAFNSAKYIKTSIESVLSQPSQDYEIVVLDDGSSDSTQDIVKDLMAIHPEKIRYYHQDNAGISKSRNKLTELARGEYILWLDSDDMLVKDVLSVYADHIHRYPDASVFYGNVILFGQRHGVWTTKDYYRNTDAILSTLKTGSSFIPNTGSVVKKSTYKLFGGYDENMVKSEDSDFWFRIAAQVTFKSIHTWSVFYRFHGNNITTKNTTYKTRFASNAQNITSALKRYTLQQLFPYLDWTKKDTANILANFEIAISYAKRYADNEALTYYEKAFQSLSMSTINLDFQKVKENLLLAFGNSPTTTRHIDCISEMLQNKDNTIQKYYPDSDYKEKPVALKTLQNVLKQKGWEYKDTRYRQFFEYVELWDVKQDPKISVIVVAWKYDDKVLNCLKLLRTQQYIVGTQFIASDSKPVGTQFIASDAEIILVNNGSPDPRFDDFKQYIDTYICLNSNTGAYLPRNIGTLFAKAPLLCFIDDDCIPHENLISAHIGLHEKYDILCARGKVLPITKNSYTPIHYNYGMQNMPAPCECEGNASFASDIFYAIGGWDDEIHMGHGGVELSLRIFQKYPEYRYQIYSPDAVIYHDFVKDQQRASRKQELQNQSKERLVAKYPFWENFYQSWKLHRQDEIVCRDAACCVRKADSGQQSPVTCHLSPVTTTLLPTFLEPKDLYADTSYQSLAIKEVIAKHSLQDIFPNIDWTDPDAKTQAYYFVAKAFFDCSDFYSCIQTLKKATYRDFELLYELFIKALIGLSEFYTAKVEAEDLYRLTNQQKYLYYADIASKLDTIDENIKNEQSLLPEQHSLLLSLKDYIGFYPSLFYLYSALKETDKDQQNKYFLKYAITCPTADSLIVGGDGNRPA